MKGEQSMKQKDWEYDNIFTPKQPGDIRKEYITYRRRAGASIGSYNVERITVVRTYFGEDDYQDSVETVIIKTSNL